MKEAIKTQRGQYAGIPSSPPPPDTTGNRDIGLHYCYHHPTIHHGQRGTAQLYCLVFSALYSAQYLLFNHLTLDINSDRFGGGRF